MDLFEKKLFDDRKAMIDDYFQDAIRNSSSEDAAYAFWFKAMRLVTPTHRGGNKLPETVYFNLREYYQELTDWLKLNYPSAHLRPVGMFTRKDHILTVH